MPALEAVGVGNIICTYKATIRREDKRVDPVGYFTGPHILRPMLETDAKQSSGLFSVSAAHANGI